MLVDAGTLAQVPAVDALVRDAAREQLHGRLKDELFASVIELNTPVCASADEALASLTELRRAAAAIAARHRLRLAAAGTHPVSRPEEQEIVPTERYRAFVEYAGVSARRQGVNGLHVHVGLPSAEACFRALEGVLPWLPLVLALSANSPYLAGEETGLASNRAEILAQLPRSGAPPRFDSYDEWSAFIERFRESGVGLADDYTSFWWDVRPHPRFGTLEIRMPDQPTAVALSGAFVALLQALCVTVLRRPARAAEPGERAIYQQNRWAALRGGTAARLVHPDTGLAAPVPELAEELLALVADAADELGSAHLLAALDVSRSESDRQLEVGRRDGPDAVCRDIVERTLRSI